MFRHFGVLVLITFLALVVHDAGHGINASCALCDCNADEIEELLDIM